MTFNLIASTCVFDANSLKCWTIDSCSVFTRTRVNESRLWGGDGVNLTRVKGINLNLDSEGHLPNVAESWRCRFPESVSPGVSPGVYTGRSRQTFQEAELSLYQESGRYRHQRAVPA